MRKICIFTQTYSDDREELFKYHTKDQSDINFRSQFDLNLYSFHNCSEEYVNKLLKFDYFRKIKNLQIIKQNNVSYTDSFKEALRIIYKNNFDYIIFLQDDSLTKSDINKEIINYIKNENFNMLNLELTPEDLKTTGKIVYKSGDFEVYDTSSEDFVKRGWYAFDDGAYAANVKFVLTNLYDEEYLSKGNVWDAETYLNSKIHKNPIQRLTTNNNFYWRYNILGRNNWDRENLLNQLKERFGND
jgi:hypothetical protein